ncbi:MAG: T9SS type A sorting domain-containing protein [Bacteroidota bacterium]
MKRLLWILIFISGLFSASAQKNTEEGIVSESPINIPTDEENKIFVKPRSFSPQLKSGQTNNLNFEVTYVGFPEEARQAFEYALSIWGNFFTSTVPVKVLAKWESIDGNVLALARPSTFHINFEGALLPDVYYPVALVEKLSGENKNGGEADIICSFNKNFSWYLGTDGNTPSTKYDFVSSVLHEIAHGLGFSGFFKSNNGKGYFNNSNNLPSVYDYFVFNALEEQLSDNSVFNRPSNELYKQLTSDNLKFHSTAITDDWIYAPASWKNGASIYHLELGSGMMDAYANRGEAIHDPEDATLEILSEMGWKSVLFEFDKLKDIEQATAEIPVEIDVFADYDISGATMKVVYSKDYFANSDSADLNYITSTNKFAGAIQTGSFQGNLQYYFKMVTDGGKTYHYPSRAPEKTFSVRIGPDFFAPSVVHNPVKIISKTHPVVELSALANDNLGIKSVKIEYKVNGELQEPVTLENKDGDLYEGLLDLKQQTLNGDVFEYRVIAEDKSVRRNKKIIPSSGFYTATLFQSNQPVRSFSTDFEDAADDFSTADFSISKAPGFYSNILHTRNPYPASAVEGEKYNLIANLKYPIILEENGEMTFDEVVLVEPGETNTTYTDEMFWDYVIIEGSKDNGATWLPLKDGYDSGDETSWREIFESSLTNNTSNAIANENMFLKHTINLTRNTAFSAGDTVLFRFRLASDQSGSGWGWAIDNLEIQKGFTTGSDGLVAESEINVYPNPFSGSFYVDCSGAENLNEVDILVTDMFGKTVYTENGIDAFYANKKQVDFSDKAPGIYLVNISDGNNIISTNKIIKN